MPKTSAKAKYLFLLRHAKAVPTGKEKADFDRPLNERGQDDALKMAALFEDQGFNPEAILCSPSLRTRQTLAPLLTLLDDAKTEFPDDLYLIDAPKLLKRLRKQATQLSTLLVIGHNPGIEDLALVLADPEADGDAAGLARMREKYPTGSLAVLKLKIDDWSGLGPGTCRLEAFVRPKDLAL